jgi:hypothetical protein
MHLPRRVAPRAAKLPGIESRACNSALPFDTGGASGTLATRQSLFRTRRRKWHFGEWPPATREGNDQSVDKNTGCNPTMVEGCLA